MSKKTDNPLNEDFKSVMDSITQMNSADFYKTLQEEKKKMLDLKNQHPNNPLFSQMDSEDFDISQEEFLEMCELITSGNISETLSEAFSFLGNMGGEKEDEKDIEGCLPVEDSNKKDSSKHGPQG